MTTFHDLALHAKLLKAIDALGFEEATEVQAQAIPAIKQGHDTLVAAKTGGGKTAAFMLPMLERFLAEDKPRSSTRGLILLPTRELALQTQKVFEELARFTYIKCGLIIGGEAFKYQVANIRKNPEALIATPGRLVEHIEKGNMDFSDLEVLVLDEADRMLDMGFAEDMHTIASQCSKNRQTLLFSATLKHLGISEISQTMESPLTLEIDSLTNGHSHIVQERILADDEKHKVALIVALVKQESPVRAIVFCKTREQCQTVSNLLKYHKLKASYIHGELSQSDRKQTLSRFRDGKLQVIVATDVAARGLDIKDIDLVINFTVAHSGDDHVHRIGRTGRAGQKGKAITLISAADWNLMAGIERYLNIRLPTRKLKGLEANYKGPKKVKSSGKAIGKKKKKPSSTSSAQKGNTTSPKNKKTPSKKQTSNINSRKQSMSTSKDGSAPLKRKK